MSIKSIKIAFISDRLGEKVIPSLWAIGGVYQIQFLGVKIKSVFLF